MGFKDIFKPKEKQKSVTWAFMGGEFFMPEDKSSTYIDKGYKSLPNLYGIISLILQKSSTVPHEVFKIKNQSKFNKYKAQLSNAKTTKDIAKAMITKAQAFEKVEGTEIEKLLNQPNKYQSTKEFNEAIDGYLLLTGNAYMYGMGNGLSSGKGKPIELHSLISPAISIITSKDFRDPIQAYKCTYLSDEIPKENIGHLKYFNPLSSYQSLENTLYGQAPLMSCRTLLGKYRDADIAQGTMFQNMMPLGILSAEKDANITEQQALSVKDRFKQLYTGVNKAGDIAITSAAFKWNQLGLSPVDLNIIQAKEEILGELCNVFHVPIGMFTKVNSTENNMVESRKMFITDAVIPVCEQRKSIINDWLVPKFGNEYYVDYDYSIFSEMSEDISKMVEAALKSYWITPNEKRELTNWDKDTNPLMDKYYFPTGLISLDDLNTQVDMVDEEMLGMNQDQENDTEAKS